ncbi:MAG: VanZ family protein [Chloroflexota bacterium]|nr:VanZ family protein [Chloroflexota bacterium]
MSDRRSIPERTRSLLSHWLPPILWMVLIFVVSAQPTLPSPPDPWLDLLLKKMAHFLEYAILAFLWWRALSGGDLHAGRPLIVAGMASILYAVSDEYHQTFVPGRHGQVWDVAVDSAGVITALGSIRWLRERHNG